MDIQTVKVQRLYLQVAHQLRDLITSGAFDVGARLPSERDLAARFGVSRPTIREAMIALEIAGLVDVRSGSGVYVMERSETLIDLSESQGPGPFEILDARKIIEGETAALAAQHGNTAQFSALQTMIDEMAEENRRDDVTERADEKFHLLIAEAAGNSALAAMVAWLWRLRNDSEISEHFQRRVRREGIRPVVSDHQVIIDAIVARDPVGARAAMERHLQRVTDFLLETL